MTIAEVLLADFDLEISNTRRTLERVPEDQPDYKPHEKSMPLGRLAMHCATMSQFGAYILQDDGMDMAAPKHPHMPLVFVSRTECLAALESSAAACRAALTGATDADMQKIWEFRFGEQLISRDTRLQSFRKMYFNHLIHHSAQLGVYYRLLGVPVPALYGPSADEPWSAK